MRPFCHFSSGKHPRNRWQSCLLGTFLPLFDALSWTLKERPSKCRQRPVSSPASSRNHTERTRWINCLFTADHSYSKLGKQGFVCFAWIHFLFSCRSSFVCEVLFTRKMVRANLTSSCFCLINELQKYGKHQKKLLGPNMQPECNGKRWHLFLCCQCYWFYSLSDALLSQLCLSEVRSIQKKCLESRKVLCM